MKQTYERKQTSFDSTLKVKSIKNRLLEEKEKKSMEERKWERKLYKPKLRPPGFFWRIINALPSFIIFLLYFGTIYPIVQFSLLPYIEFSFWEGTICTILYIVFLNLTLWTWMKAMFTDAGGVPSFFFERVAEGEIHDQYVTWCRKCESPRPVRSHHCSTFAHLQHFRFNFLF